MKAMWIVGALCTICLSSSSPALSAAPSTMKLYVAGTGGSEVYVIDVATNVITTTLKVGKQPHGIAATTDGRWVWIATEGDGKIHKIDAVHEVVAESFDLGPYQQEMEITNDGRMLYTGRFMDGCYDVFDTMTKKVVAHLPVDGSPHNVVKAARDDHFMYLAPMNLSPTGGDSDVAAKFAITRGVLRDCDGKPKSAYVTNDKIYVVDTRENKIVGTISVGSAPRPIIVSDDGKRLYADVDGLLGFLVIDVASRKVIERVKFPLVTEDERLSFSRAHGIGITPDQKELWTNSVNHGVVYAYDRTVEPVKLIARIPVGASPYWIAFSPDNRFGYIALAEADAIAVIDVGSHTLIKIIALPKNSGPKTIQVVSVPAE